MLWHLCQSTLSKPHQIQWVWIHLCCSRNSLLLGTGVLKDELCVYPPALFEATGTMLQSDKSSQANAIQRWVQPSSTQIPQDISYIYDGGAQIHKIPWKTWQTYCGKYTAYVKKRSMTNQISVSWLPRWSFYRRQFPSEMEEIIFLLERGNLGALLKRAFLSWRTFDGGSPLQLQE